MSEQQMPELRAREFAAFLLQKRAGTMTSFTILEKNNAILWYKLKKGVAIGFLALSRNFLATFSLLLRDICSSLYNAYDRSIVEDKLVIKIDQDSDHASKFSVADDISEVYDLPGIYECINGQKPLKALESYSQRIALLIDHHKLKAFTELVYTITGEKFSKYIDRGLPDQNFNLHLIDNSWNELDYARVQPPSSLGLDIRPRMLSIVKNNNPLRISVAPLGCPLCKRIHDKDQWWFSRVYVSSWIFIVKCFRICKIKGLGFLRAFIKLPFWTKYNEALTATETYEERYVRPLPDKGDIYVGSP
ncbi:8899_t:CDS:2 [Funneliformis geosporum]|uniref:8899_t:CDS:1 n=1 Tax=Funneliformis geosporum TaxID=1117311 RepID=A0A9W4SY52_9GLOM|nr:8899_t:CDS:2 [Funneliformis geosporum]